MNSTPTPRRPRHNLALMAGCLLALGTSLPAYADRDAPHRSTGRAFGHAPHMTQYAEVIRVEPIYRRIEIREPRQECWTETRREIVTTRPAPQRHNQSASHGNALAGAVIGGLIGNQIGRRGSSSNRAGATVAGAIIGGALAGEASGSDGTARHRRPRPQLAPPQREQVIERPVEQCTETVATRYESVIDSYDVTWRYLGRQYTSNMDHDPGRRLEVEVEVRPIGTSHHRRSNKRS